MMAHYEGLTERIHESAKEKILYTEHALDKMNIEEEIITKDEVRDVIFNGDIIEDYPEDIRGHSCLILGCSGKGRLVHVVCSPKKDYLGIITVYLPSQEKWRNDFRNKEEKMKCLYCRGEMEKTFSCYTIDRDGYHLYIKDIPAYICSQCGEKLFEEKEVEAIQDMIKSLEKKIEKVQTVAV